MIRSYLSIGGQTWIRRIGGKRSRWQIVVAVVGTGPAVSPGKIVIVGVSIAVQAKTEATVARCVNQQRWRSGGGETSSANNRCRLIQWRIGQLYSLCNSTDLVSVSANIVVDVVRGHGWRWCGCECCLLLNGWNLLKAAACGGSAIAGNARCEIQKKRVRR